jgi:hypothetical protein
MTIGKNALSAIALFAALPVLSAEVASAASVNQQFSAAVARVLNSVKSQEEFLRELSASEFRTFVRCAQSVMADAPTARKQYVLSSPNMATMRQRFDEVALDNRAQLKQRITAECA